jgi:hypothetical protein
MAGAFGCALHAPAAVRELNAAPGAAAPGRGVVLRIVQDGNGPGGGAAAASAVDAPLLWRLGACEILDPRRLDQRLARWPDARIHALVDSANHLLLVDALRQHRGAILRERWSAAEQRWTLVARVRAERGARQSRRTGVRGDDADSSPT